MDRIRPIIASRGAWTWLLGCLTLFATVNACYGVLVATRGESTFQPYLIGDIIGRIPVTLYIGLSLVFAFIFMGGTVLTAFFHPRGRPSVDPQMDKLLTINQRVLTLTTELVTQFHTTLEAHQQRTAEHLDALNHKIRQLQKETLTEVQRQNQYLRFLIDPHASEAKI